MRHVLNSSPLVTSALSPARQRFVSQFSPGPRGGWPPPASRQLVVRKWPEQRQIFTPAMQSYRAFRPCRSSNEYAQPEPHGSGREPRGRARPAPCVPPVSVAPGRPKFTVAEVVQVAPNWALARTNSAGTVTVNATGAKALKRTRNSSSSRRAPTGRGRLLDTVSPRPIRRYDSNKLAQVD